LNPHASRRHPLKLVCLPFHHFRNAVTPEYTKRGRGSEAGGVTMLVHRSRLVNEGSSVNLFKQRQIPIDNL